MHYKWTVLETYRDGFVWTHPYTTKQNAERAMEDMQAAHKGRIYKLVEVNG